jgi:hypothetical protein
VRSGGCECAPQLDGDSIFLPFLGNAAPVEAAAQGYDYPADMMHRSGRIRQTPAPTRCCHLELLIGEAEKVSEGDGGH